MPISPTGIGMNFNVRGMTQRSTRPFRILVLADFSAGTRETSAPHGLVTPSNYGDVSQRLATTLDLDVDNHLVPRGAPQRVRLPLADLSDLSPAGVIANVSELTTLYLFRERLQLYLRREISTEEFVAGLASYQFADALIPHVQRCRDAIHTSTASVPNPSAPPPKSVTDVDRILDLVARARPDDAPSTPRSAVDTVAASLGAMHAIPSAASNAITQSIREVTDLLNRQISAILHHPHVVEAESTWRGLRFLLDRTVTGAVEIELIDTPFAAIETALNQHLNVPGATPSTAPSLIVIDFEFGSDTADVTLLQRIGTLAMEAQIPCVFSAKPDFFGEVPDDARPLPFLGTVLDQPRYTAWRSLRDKECARWLCGGFNPMVLREPYTPANTRGLDYTEASVPANARAWGRPGWMIATLVARSVNLTHWPTQITGMQYGQLTQLPLHSVASAHAGEAQIPLRSVLTMQNADDLAQCGLASLLCQPNRDSAYLLYAPTLRRAQSAADHAMDTGLVSLPYQLFVAHITETVRADRDLWSGELSGTETAEHMQQTLNELLADTGPNHAAHVQLTPDPDRRNRSLLQLDLHAGHDILNGASVQMTLPV